MSSTTLTTERLPLQRSPLRVSQPDDSLEKEAEELADRVMRMPSPEVGLIQRCPGDCPDEETVHRQPADEEEEEELIQRSPDGPDGTVRQKAASAIQARRVGGDALPLPIRRFFEPRFGADFSKVRVHHDSKAADLATQVNARAFAVGQDLFFGSGQWSPGSFSGNRLIAHELAHTVLHGESGAIRRQPVFPAGDPNVGAQAAAIGVTLTSCDAVAENIEAAWPRARDWVRLAISELRDADSVSGELQRHFRIDPADESHLADLVTVRRRFQAIADIMDNPVNIFCTPPNVDEQCHNGDGREYGAYVTGQRSDRHMFMCTSGSASEGFLSRADLMGLIVHEIAHNVDPAVTDWAYRHKALRKSYGELLRHEAIDNADSYSEFAAELYAGTTRRGPLQATLSPGALLSSGRPLWAVRAAVSLRSRTGLEVFDLVGGFSYLVVLDPPPGRNKPEVRELGVALDIGVLSRGADTHMFADVRAGGFATLGLGRDVPNRAGISGRALIGWADSGFRAGIDMTLLYDLLEANHGLIVGGTFGVDF